MDDSSPSEGTEKNIEQEKPFPSSEQVTVTKKKISLNKLNGQVATVISLTMKLIALIALMLVFVAVVRQLSFDGYLLHEIILPEDFEQAGFTSNAVAAKVKANIKDVKYRVEQSYLTRFDLTDEKTLSSHLLENHNSEIEVSLVGVGLSLNSIVNLAGTSLGISNAKKVSAYVSMDDGEVALLIDIQNQKPIHFKWNLDSLGILGSANTISWQISESILKIDNTELLAYYFSFGERTPDDLRKVIELAKFGLANDPDTSRAKYYEHMWAYALNSQGNNREALAMAEKAIAHGGQFISAYISAADALKELKQYEKSRSIIRRTIAILQKSKGKDNSVFLRTMCYQRMVESYFLQGKSDSLAIIPEDSVAYFRSEYINYASQTNDTRDLARAYDEIGYFYSEEGLYDSAIVNVNKAILTDSSYYFPYYTMAQIFGYKKDRERFYQFFERALAKGLKDRLKISDSLNLSPPDSWYKREARFKAIWKTYIK